MYSKTFRTLLSGLLLSCSAINGDVQYDQNYEGDSPCCAPHPSCHAMGGGCFLHMQSRLHLLLNNL